MNELDPFDPFSSIHLPVAEWIEHALRWVVDQYRPFFQTIKWPIDQVLAWFAWLFNAIPPTPMIVLLGLIAWQIASWRLALGLVCSLVIIGLIGAWPDAMTTLSIVFAALILCIAAGVPLGILCARSDRFFAVLRPILDTMQTIPSFVYLVPVVMLFEIGNVPGVIVTIIFAIPPVIRLTNLGIRQVSTEVVEALLSFGATRWQLLYKAEIPLALPTIMAGINQTLMMSLSMVVIASMIAVGGLGQTVLRGMGRLDMGTATVGGVGIVLLAIVLDRLTQALGSNHHRASMPWNRRGPVGFTLRAAAILRRPRFRTGATASEVPQAGSPSSVRSQVNIQSPNKKRS
jgi:glycine betaine/proline transport system permease protein